MEQNAFFWLVPQKEQPALLLCRGASKDFDFVQCFDGRFSYEIWVYTQSNEDLYMGMALDNQPVYNAMRLRCTPEKRWIQLGNFQATKGEHRVTITAVNQDCCLEGLLICRNADYIHNGTATEHIPRIVADKILAVISSKYVFLLLLNLALLVVGCLMAGMDVAVATPKGYEPDPTVLEYAKQYGDKFTLTEDVMEAAKDLCAH